MLTRYFMVYIAIFTSFKKKFNTKIIIIKIKIKSKEVKISVK